MKSLFKWIQILRREGGSWSPLTLFTNALYNNMIWHPEGEWPYGMKKRKKMLNRIPEFCLSHWLWRIPLAIVFIQQGLDKWPVDADTAADWGLPLVVWTFVVFGELGAGIGLLIGGLLTKPWLPILKRCYIPDVGDALTRFSGITMCCIMTGVIWIGEPASFMDVLLYDNLHVLLWVGGLFFALRGNRI